MKTTRTLRLLTLLGFLLLLAPFYDACDGRSLFEKVPESDIVIKQSFQEKAYDVIVDEEAFNAFEIAAPILTTPLKETKAELIDLANKNDWYNNLLVFVSFTFSFIVVISFLLIILSFFKRQKLFAKLALTNCILVISTFLYIISLESSFEHWHQIKWGYYSFIIVSISIFYFSKLTFKRHSS